MVKQVILQEIVSGKHPYPVEALLGMISNNEIKVEKVLYRLPLPPKVREAVISQLNVSELPPLEQIYTFQEAAKKWRLNESTLRRAKHDNRFLPGEIKENYNIVTHAAMVRLYGEPKRGN